MDKYLPRLIDSKVDSWLKTFGAVSIEGPKWIGKTMTCEQRARSAYYFTAQPGRPDPLELARLDSSYVFNGDKPRLIDEWQLMPEIWDMVRFDVDSHRGEKGLYLLTGSSLPPQKDAKGRDRIHHSGAGRIGSLRMSTMTLFETGDSSGEVSLSSMFGNEPVHGSMRNMGLGEIIHFIVRGGWPGNLDAEDPSIIPRDYIDRVYSYELDKLDIPDIDIVRFRRLMMSLARNESTVASMSTLAKDAGLNGKALDDATAAGYLEILRSIYLVDEQEAFSPDFRSRSRLKIGSKRHFADPSIAAAVIGANERNLVNDLQYLGFLFESLAVHDLKVYMAYLGGRVWHYQDYDNDEVDAVVELADGSYGLIEIKLGYGDVIDNAASGLLKVQSKLERKPEFLAIISGMAPAPVRRPDGIYVVPLTSLKP